MLNNLIKPVKTLEDRQERIIVREKGVAFGDLVAQRLALPGLVGCWPMSSIQRSTGNAYDLSGQARTLTYNGNPTFNYTSLGVPYVDLDGTGDYLSRADETDLDIQGSETIYASAVRGFMIYDWIYTDSVAGGTAWNSKIAATNATSSWLGSIGGGPLFNFNIYNGANTYLVSSTTVPAISSWYGVACRFIPSTSIDIFVMSAAGITKTTNTTSIPATINSTAANFNLGGAAGGSLLWDGRQSLSSLYANQHSDAMVRSLFNQERVLFGV